MNKGIIDIGTNSTRLLIIAPDREQLFERIHKDLRVTRIGTGLEESGRISEAAIAPTIEALNNYLEICKTFRCDDVYCFATAAMREAQNKQDIVDRVYREIGLKIDVISGEKEAEYGYLGASAAFNRPVRILDVGGGSTELINGEGSRMGATVSMKMGCVRFTEAYLPDDPPTPEQLEQLKKAAERTLKENGAQISDGIRRQLVSIGGTATTVATMLMKLEAYDGNALHLKVVHKAELDNLIDEMKELPLECRKIRVGLDPTRADIILAGLVITSQAMTYLGAKETVICDWDNLEGAAVSRFIKKT